LLIVTPPRTIHVIEPFVYGVGFARNEDRWASKAGSPRIEAYRKEKGRIVRGDLGE